MDYIKELTDNIRKANVVLFLGSGFSLKAGGPRSSDLVDAIKSKMTHEQKSSLVGLQLEYVASEYEQMYNRNSLLHIIEEKMKFARGDMSNHILLTQIPHFRTIITTNYDTLIEEAYGDNCYVVRTSSDCVNIPSNKIKLYKFLGDFIVKDNIIITEEDYTNYFTNRKNNMMWNVVTSEMLTHDVLFMGYSIDDSNIFELIKQMREDTFDSRHNFYVVAPIQHKHKIKRLEDAGLRHIDKRAEEILPIIIDKLNKEVTRDYRKKQISNDIFIKYCQIHGIIPTIKPGTDNNPNTITSFDILKLDNISVHFSLPKESAVSLTHIDFEKKNNNLHVKKNDNGIPSCTLKADELKDFEVTMNNMVTYDQDTIKELMILPCTHDVNASLYIPSIGFHEKVMYTLYGITDGCHAILSTETYNIDITIRNTKEESDFNIIFKEKYINNSNAIKWMDFLIALSQGEVIHSTEVLTTFSVKRNEALMQYVQNMKQYYKNLSEIEFQYGVSFDEYENYSFERFKISQILLSACNERFIDVSSKYNKEDFSIDSTTTPLQLREMSIEKGQHFALQFSQEMLTPYKLCGKEFIFKNRITMINDAEIIATIHGSNNATKIILRSIGNAYELFTNKEPEYFLDKEKKCHRII